MEKESEFVKEEKGWGEELANGFFAFIINRGETEYDPIKIC